MTRCRNARVPAVPPDPAFRAPQHRWQVVLRVLSKERANTRLTARVRPCGDRDTRFWLVAATPDATVEILDRLDHLARTRRLPNSLRSPCSTSSRSVGAAAMGSLEVFA